MTPAEKRLVRKLAEAYAFIYDLREMAKWTSNAMLLRRTAGIEEQIADRRKEYPTLFQRHFNTALKRGIDARLAEEKDAVDSTAVRPQKKEAKPPVKPPSRPKGPKKRVGRRLHEVE